MFKKILAVTLLVASTTWAQDTNGTFKGESEASSVIVSGNVNTETIGAKSKNTLNLTEWDLATLFGSYVTTKAAGTVTGKSWTAGLRYEHVFVKDLFSGYLQQMSESDPYNGIFTQRDSTDIGGKYFFLKSDDFTWLAELGYRYSKIYDGVITNNVTHANYARLYTEVETKFNTSTSGKIWAEYLPNLKESDKYLWKAEASVSVVMSTLLSLKMSYLISHNEAMVAPLKKDSSTWITALVANY